MEFRARCVQEMCGWSPDRPPYRGKLAASVLAVMNRIHTVSVRWRSGEQVQLVGDMRLFGSRWGSGDSAHSAQYSREQCSEDVVVRCRPSRRAARTAVTNAVADDQCRSGTGRLGALIGGRAPEDRAAFVVRASGEAVASHDRLTPDPPRPGSRAATRVSRRPYGAGRRRPSCSGRPTPPRRRVPPRPRRPRPTPRCCAS